MLIECSPCFVRLRLPPDPSSPHPLPAFSRRDFDLFRCIVQRLYACVSWTLTAELQRRIQATEMRRYRKILRILYKGHVTNEKVYAKIQRAIRPHEDLLTIVKRLRLGLGTYTLFRKLREGD